MDPKPRVIVATWWNLASRWCWIQGPCNWPCTELQAHSEGSTRKPINAEPGGTNRISLRFPQW